MTAVGARFDDSRLRGEMAAGARSVAALGQRVWSWARASERAADSGQWIEGGEASMLRPAGSGKKRAGRDLTPTVIRPSPYIRGSGLVSQMAAIGHAAGSSSRPRPGEATELRGPAEMAAIGSGAEGRFGQGCRPEEAVVVFEQPGGDQPVSGRVLRRVG